MDTFQYPGQLVVLYVFDHDVHTFQSMLQLSTTVVETSRPELLHFLKRSGKNYARLTLCNLQSEAPPMLHRALHNDIAIHVQELQQSDIDVA